MDNLTHTAIGLFLARAGLRRLSPLATPILLVAANIPDIDVAASAGGALNYLHYHRHLTHSLLLMPVLALAAVGIVRLAAAGIAWLAARGWLPRRVAGSQAVRGLADVSVHWTGAFVAALIALGTHLLLDCTNVYGVRLLLPFSDEWLRWDVTNVVDLWIWDVCAVSIAGPFLGRLVGGEIASSSRRPANHGRGFARFALAFVLLYDCARGVAHARAVTAISSRMYEDAAPVRTVACPDFINPFQWRGVIETPGAYFVQEVNLLARDPLAARPAVFHKPDSDPALEAPRRQPAFQEFLRFSQFPLWRVSPYSEIENGRVVEVFDMRFGSPLAPGFMISAIVNGQGKVVRVAFEFWPKPR